MKRGVDPASQERCLRGRFCLARKRITRASRAPIRLRNGRARLLTSVQHGMAGEIVDTVLAEMVQFSKCEE